MYSKEEIIEICKSKLTIPLEKLNFNAFDHPAPTVKTKEWIDVYFERSRFEELNPSEFVLEVKEFITENCHQNYQTNYHCVNSFCDIYLPDIKTGFKFLPLFEYSEINVNKNNQVNTWKDFESEEIHIVQIFEDSWNLKKDLVKNRIMNILGRANKIYARTCKVKVVTDTVVIKSFVEASHIQGNIGSAIKLGLYHNNELVSLMTFGTLRKNLGQTGQAGSYELLRFCNKFGLNVVGGASKLFNYFIKTYNPSSVISYADKCWSASNCLYTKLGMVRIHDSDPSYFYIIGKKRKGRFGYRKDVVLEVGFDGSIVGEHTGMISMDIYRIFDCGTMKFEWINS